MAKNVLTKLLLECLANGRRFVRHFSKSNATFKDHFEISVLPLKRVSFLALIYKLAF